MFDQVETPCSVQTVIFQEI